MPALPSIYPDGDSASLNTANLIVVGGTGTYASAIAQDPTTGQPDASYVANNNTAAGATHFTLGAFPIDVSKVDTLTARLHVVASGRTDDNIELRVGVYAADETTLLAGDAGGAQGATVGTNPNGAFNVTLTLTATGAAANRATWDAAVLRVNWIYSQSMSKDNYTLRLHAIRLEGTYTATVNQAFITNLLTTSSSVFTPATLQEQRFFTPILGTGAVLYAPVTQVGTRTVVGSLLAAPPTLHLPTTQPGPVSATANFIASSTTLHPPGARQITVAPLITALATVSTPEKVMLGVNVSVAVPHIYV